MASGVLLRKNGESIYHDMLAGRPRSNESKLFNMTRLTSLFFLSRRPLFSLLSRHHAPTKDDEKVSTNSSCSLLL
ncbi:hypothetical protein LguiB_012093 [Lonicera macranthoides]